MQLKQRFLDSFASSREALRREMGQQFLDVQQQLVQIQELSGQSQRRLAELKRQMDDRSERLGLIDTTPAAPVPAASADTARPAPPAGTPTPDQLFQSSLQELRRGSLA